MAGEINTNYSIVVGSSSEIGGWIQKGIRLAGGKCLTIGRKNNSPDLVTDSYGNYNLMANLIRSLYERDIEPSTYYFCPGSYSDISISESNPNDWNQEIFINLNSAYIFYKAVIDAIGESHVFTKLVFLGSTASISRPKNYSSYSIAKAALENLITYINNEKPNNVRALCLRLGTCRTKFSNASEAVDLIEQQDLISCINFIENSRFEVFPDLISIRPIRHQDK